MATQQHNKTVAVSAAGIACNLLLAAAKITMGVLCGMVSVLADGFNNLGDCGGSVVTLVSACVAAKPADKSHPYGHRRAEYVASMITGFLVLALAVELLRESVDSIISGVVGSADAALFAVLSVSIAVKAAMAVCYRIAGKRLDSDSLRAAATDSLCDCIATGAVIAGGVLSYFGIAADGYIGIAVALFVCWQGVRIVREASSKLLGQAPDVGQVNRIKALVLSFEGVLGLHDLHLFCYGSGVTYATLHVEMDCGLTSMQAHAVLDEIEHRVLAEEGVQLTAHLDPVDTQDSESAALGRKLRIAVEEAIADAELHDFRLIRGAVDKVVFDVGVPFECKLTDAQVLQRVQQAVRTVGEYEVVATVERE